MSVPGAPFPPVLRPLTATGPLELGTVDPIEWVSRASTYFHAQALCQPHWERPGSNG
jgi:hypothetical protein